MFALPLWSFHIGFFGGVPWSWAAEAATLSAYWSGSATWDLLWFLLNPRYGWSRFRKGEIWWHAGTWIGRFPIDYWGSPSCPWPSPPPPASQPATSGCSAARRCC